MFTFGYMHTFFKNTEITALLAQPLEVTVKTKNSIDVIAIGADINF
jgi:hypothetical protein